LRSERSPIAHSELQYPRKRTRRPPIGVAAMGPAGRSSRLGTFWCRLKRKGKPRDGAAERHGSVNLLLTGSMLDNSTMIETDLIIQEEAAALGPYALIVNNHVNVGQGLAAAIAALGVECSVCESVKTAFALFDKRRPAIIFLDISLHRSEVIQLVEALRARGFAGILQLMCGGGRLQLAKLAQQIGECGGLRLRPPLRKPYRLADIRAAVSDASELNVVMTFER
jgi:ActR/RegA family two-component response regulator